MQLRIYAKFIPSTLIFIFVLVSCITTAGHGQEFTQLAYAFLHGHLNLYAKPPELAADWVYYHGRYYWPLGPLPAIILTPFVLGGLAVGIFFSQAYLQVLLVLGLFYVIVAVARRLRYSLQDSIFWAFGFILGSAYIGVAANSSTWFFSHIITVALLFVALFEYFGQKRWWLLGLLSAGLLMTRLDASFIIIFFAWEIMRGSVSSKQKLRQLASLAWPFGVAGLWLAWYNFARFGNIWEQGYALQVLSPVLVTSRNQGIVSWRHIPTNLYYGFISSPSAVLNTAHNLVYPYIASDPWGMSIFWTSPYLLYLFTLKRSELRGWLGRLSAVTLLIILFLLCWFATGAIAYGYRFSLDFMPELLVILMVVYKQRHKNLTAGMRTLLLLAGYINFYLLITNLHVVR